MRRTVDLCVLLLFSCCCFTRGDHSKESFTTSHGSPSETSTLSIHIYSTTESNSITNSSAPLLNSNSDIHNFSPGPSANGALSQSGNDTTDSITASASTTAVADKKEDSNTTVNGTDVPGNHSESQDGTDLSAGLDITISTKMAPTSTSLLGTQLPEAKPQSNTSASTILPQTLSASTPLAQNTSVSHGSATTSPETTTPKNMSVTSTATTNRTTSQSQQKSSTTVIEQLRTTTITIKTTEASNSHGSTPVQAKARADTPSELNVGDDESSVSMDPLLAGLVSVFVVTAAIVSLLIFLKFRRRNERPEFRRLQDLPMDDMMEDTPLSMYTY